MKTIARAARHPRTPMDKKEATVPSLTPIHASNHSKLKSCSLAIQAQVRLCLQTSLSGKSVNTCQITFVKISCWHLYSKNWSANEVCACLRDDAKDILNARPGKDKTMVFQKRLERVRKDMLAKDQLKILMHPDYKQYRDDGRPTWVKRGNQKRPRQSV